MAERNFFKKLASAYLLGHMVAVLIVLSLLGIAVKYGLDIYTHHGESIVVPNVVRMQYDDAADKLEAIGLGLAVNDTGYNEKLPPDCILEQSPVNGKRVKGGYVVYVTVNAASPPTLAIPDIIENSSWREARSKLISMGFKRAEPEYIPGERDWIYGVKVDGKNVRAGDRVPLDTKVVVLVGDGTRMAGTYDSLAVDDIDFEEIEVEEPEYEYEEVEVPVDAEGNEITNPYDE